MVTYVYNRAPVQLRSKFLENGQSSYLELNFVLALQFWPSLFEFQVDQTVGWLSPKGGIGITPGVEINPVMILRPLRKLNEPL